MRGWLLTIACLAAAATHGEDAAVRVSLRPAFDGHCQPGWPMVLWVEVDNEGAAFEGWLDVVAGGVAFRQEVKVGAKARPTLESLVAPPAGTGRVRVVVRSAAGQRLCEQDFVLALRSGNGPLVATAPGAEALARRLTGAPQVVAESRAWPTLAAGYAGLDAVVLAGPGGELPAQARAALCAWVRGGGRVGFALEAGEPVNADSLLAELGECAGRATAAEWLEAAAALRHAKPLGGGIAWRLGLGKVAAGIAAKLPDGAFAPLLPVGERGATWTDRALYEAFRGARWAAGVRWRLAGGAVALVAVGLLLAGFAARGRGRLAGAALALAVAGGLAAVAWAAMLPAGRGVLEVCAVAERADGQQGERMTEVLCLEATGRTRVRLDLGYAEAVVPFYHGAEERLPDKGLVIERDASGRWTAECSLTGNSRRVLAAWWPWRRAAAEPRGQGGEWLSVAKQGGWGAAHRALAAWQERRAGTAEAFRVGPVEGYRSAVSATGVIEQRVLAAQVWTRTGD